MSEVLCGYTVGVTADRRSEEQLLLLSGRGATCLHGPTIRTHALVAESAIHAVTDRVLQEPPDVMIALTGIGVRGWFETARARGDEDALVEVLHNARVLARGPKAHGAATTAELDVEWVASGATASEVFDHVVATVEPGASIVVQNDGAAGQPFADRLVEAGYEAYGVPVYRWSLPENRGPAETLIRAVVDLRVDAVTFTSGAAIDHFVDIAADLRLSDDVRAAFRAEVLPVCVGPVTAAAALAAGLGEPIQPARHRLGAMVQQLTDALTARSHSFELGGHAVELRGRLVQVGDEEAVELSARERSVLLALLERPGVVRSKAHLLDRVWTGSDVGAHVVEVTVGRLRRRLGPAGLGIETVFRRGYRASTT